MDEQYYAYRRWIEWVYGEGISDQISQGICQEFWQGGRPQDAGVSEDRRIGSRRSVPSLYGHFQFLCKYAGLEYESPT